MTDGRGSTTHEELIEQHMRRCRHFTGIQNECCSAGVRYTDVRDESEKPFRFPCTKPAVSTCGFRSLPTREEAEQLEREDSEAIERFIKARAAIVAMTGGKRSVRGRADCPNCSGHLDFSVASNGHIWANCSTKGCASWRE